MTIPELTRWWVCLIAAAIGTGAVFADQREIQQLQQEILFHIEAGSLEFALIQFSRQAQMQIVVAPHSAPDITVPAVHGRFAAGATLAALLKGTGLVYTAVGNTITVWLPAQKPNGSNDARPPKPTAHAGKTLDSRRPAASL
jgi:hypothetical protein